MSAVDGAHGILSTSLASLLLLAQDTPSLENLKLKYYQLLIRYHSHNNSYIDICRCYKAIYETDSIAEDPEQWKPVGITQAATRHQLLAIP